MGYSLWIEDKKSGLIKRGKTKRVDVGNMLCIGGTTSLEYNITYNYGRYYYEVEGFEDNGIREIYGVKAVDSIPLLEKLKKGIENKYKKDGKWITSKTDKGEIDEGDDSDYWKATAINACKAIDGLLNIAKEGGDGIWNGD